MTESRKSTKNRGETRKGSIDEGLEETRDSSQESSTQSQPVERGENESTQPDSGPQEADNDNSVRPRSSGPLVWMALLFALASLGLASYPFWSDLLPPPSAENAGPSTSEFERLVRRVDTIRQESATELEDLRDELDKLSFDFETGAPGPDAELLTERIDQLSAEVTALAEAPGPDPSILAGRIDQLSAEVTALAEAPGPDPSVLAGRIDQLSAEVKALVDAPGPDLSALAERIDQLSVRVERLQSNQDRALGGTRSRLAELESEVGRRLDQFERNLSNVGSNLDQADRNRVSRLLLTEVDSLFGIAQNLLLVGGDPALALKSWERAVERLTALEGTEFQNLKEIARRELTQLQTYRPPDLGPQIERLFGMTDAVSGWPVKTIQPGRQQGEPGRPDGWRGRLGQVVGSLVQVESVDREFLGPDEIDMVRERVRSTLQTAALAMARSRPDLARRLIGEAAEDLQGVFDVEAPEVAEALNWLEGAAASEARIDPPELNESRAEIARLLGGMR